MPFLRRRGVMASESDMRRHTFFNPLVSSKLSQSQSQQRPCTAIPESEVAAPFHPLPGSDDEPVRSQSASAATDPARSSVDASSGQQLPSIVTPSGSESLSFVPAVSSFPTPPITPPVDPTNNASGDDATRGGMSIDSDVVSRPESPPIQEQTPRHHRFSLLRFRNASDSQLAARARQHALAEELPPLPRPPEIITTAPTFELGPVSDRRPPRTKLISLARKSGELPRIDDECLAGSAEGPSNSGIWPRKNRRRSLEDQSTNGSAPHPNDGHGLPPYGDESGTALALPVNRLSESSRSDGSSGDRVYGSTTTTTHTVHTTTTFFRLPRRRKNGSNQSLFPISHLPQKGRPTTPMDRSPAPPLPSRASTESGFLDELPRMSSSCTSFSRLSSVGEGQQTPTQSRPTTPSRALSSQSNMTLSPARALFQKGNPSPAAAFFRPSSRNSGRSSPTRSTAGTIGRHARGRSSTLSSLNRDSIDERYPPPLTVRSSSSATGRKSFSDLLGRGLGRVRQNSELSAHQGSLTPATPGSNTSKNNSLNLTRDSITLPERRDDDTPAKYLARLEEVVSRSVIASALSKSTDAFSQAVLRSYMRSFKFFGEPMDMAIRKLLMEAELPKETQQIDRCLQAFANRYHECNPGIYSSPDQAYFIAFSLLILHTDVFNKNNKHKMQKADYVKNTHGEGIFDEVLEVFYDNITYTPFIHVEDDFDINGERIITHKAKRKSIFPNTNPDAVKKSSKEPIDPYTLIIDNKLDTLRPNLRDVMQLEDPYSYVGTAQSLNMKELQNTFFRTGVLQIVSARSRPDAFMTEKTVTNPEEAHPGIVDIKITKVGLLWRKDAKKKKARSPWQEWGAILTGAQLYFFRNTAWVKSLIHQYESHIRHGHDGIPIIFKPPLEDFKPDALISTDGAVALLDSSYKKHKHAFTYVRHGGDEEVLLADNEEEMNDWLAKLNYAAAFRTSGVRMRGVVGGLYEGQNRRALRRLGSDETQSVQTPSGEVTITRSRIDQKMAEDILAARRGIMLQKVADANEKLEAAEKKLEVQLRNSRHLQIMSPIQPKTREQMLHAATRLSTQVKYTMVEMWRLKCHRDILEMDLDEERQVVEPEHALESGAALAGMVAAASSTVGLSVDSSSSLHQPQGNLTREESQTSSATAMLQPCSPRSATHGGSLAGGSIGSGSAGTLPLAATESTLSDGLQAASTSMPTASLHQHRPQTSTDLSQRTSMFEGLGLRKGSVSSAMSASSFPAMATPQRVGRGSSSAHDSVAQRQTPGGEDGANEVDADEQDLLQKSGLLEHTPARTTGSSANSKAAASEESSTSPMAGTPGPGPHSAGSQALTQGQPSSPAQHDKNKIRRSLHRTLREGAGHLSHHRGRRTKDGQPGSGTDEAAGEDQVVERLERGTGSFVVHGKKASVISFGGDLQSILPSDERLRQRKSLQATSAAVAAITGTSHGDVTRLSEEDGESSFGCSVEESSSMSTSVMTGDYRTAMQQHQRDHERRESAASASTATARSFRELHRKYSSVRGTSRSSMGGRSSRGAAHRDDDESEVAVSVSGVSDGGHMPLTPALEEAEVRDGKGQEKAGREDGEENEDDDRSIAPSTDGQAEFYTPDPPASPRSMTPEPGEAEAEAEREGSSAAGLAVQAMQA